MSKKNSRSLSNHSCNKHRSYKKPFILLLISAILIAVIIFTAYGLAQNVDLQILTEQAISNNLAADTYCFSSKSVLHIGTEERCFADLIGEKSGPRDRHISGTLVGTDVDIFFVDGILFRKDPISGTWSDLVVGELDNAMNIMSELEPATNFAFESIGEVADCGREKIDGKNCYIVSFMPVLQDEWIKTYFGNIRYKLWITGRKEPQIIKAQIEGDSLENTAAGLTIILGYSNYNSSIILHTPVIKEK